MIDMQLVRYTGIYQLKSVADWVAAKWNARASRWLERKHQNEASPVRLTNRRIYVWPTKWGLAFAVTMLAMLTASVNYVLGLGYATTFLLGGLASSAIWQAFAALNRLEFTALSNTPVFAGDVAHLEWSIFNPTKRDRHAIVMWAEKNYPVEVTVPAFGRVTIAVPFPVNQRGWFSVKRITVLSTFPLGMVRAWGYLMTGQRGLVYPHREENAPPIPGWEEKFGEILRGVGQEDFAGLRPYQQTDSPRHVAWKLMARGAPLLTKRFEGGGSHKLWIDWQSTPATMSTEDRLSRLCRWVWEAHQMKVAFGLRLPTHTIPLAHGIQHAHACFSALALYGPDTQEESL